MNTCSQLLLHEGTSQGQVASIEELLWWPFQMGQPTQHNLTTTFASTATTTLVGLRQMNVSLDPRGNAVLRVNGRQILVRGGGWAPDLLQRSTSQRLAQELRLTRDLGLNAIRLEGKFESDELFERASALGLLMIPGICCCDTWQQWDVWTEHTLEQARASIADQVKRLRRHASIALFMYSSDKLPIPSVEKVYLQVFKEERWANGLVASAANDISTLTGGTGVKMAGTQQQEMYLSPPSFALNVLARSSLLIHSMQVPTVGFPPITGIQTPPPARSEVPLDSVRLACVFPCGFLVIVPSFSNRDLPWRCTAHAR